MFCVSDSDVILSKNSSTMFPAAICGDLLQYTNNDETDHESMKYKQVVNLEMFLKSKEESTSNSSGACVPIIH